MARLFTAIHLTLLDWHKKMASAIHQARKADPFVLLHAPRQPSILFEKRP